MASNNHGHCVHCGYDLTGDSIYETFLKQYGDENKALEVSEMFGATKESGRWGKAVYVKLYDEDFNKLTPYYQCPSCREKCYEYKSF